MGPRLMSRGGELRRRPPREHLRRFNGAAAHEPRRPALSAKHDNAAALQWGRGS